MGTLAAIFLTVSIQYDLPPGMLSAVCMVESNHTPTAIHRNDGNGDSLGICQIKASTARQFGFTGNAEDLMDPQTNITYAAAYLAWQLERYDYDTMRGLTAYNKGCSTGSGRSTYAKKVIETWEAQSYTWYFQGVQ